MANSSSNYGDDQDLSASEDVIIFPNNYQPPVSWNDDSEKEGKKLKKKKRKKDRHREGRKEKKNKSRRERKKKKSKERQFNMKNEWMEEEMSHVETFHTSPRRSLANMMVDGTPPPPPPPHHSPSQYSLYPNQFISPMDQVMGIDKNDDSDNNNNVEKPGSLGNYYRPPEAINSEQVEYNQQPAQFYNMIQNPQRLKKYPLTTPQAKEKYGFTQAKETYDLFPQQHNCSNEYSGENEYGTHVEDYILDESSTNVSDPDAGNLPHSTIIPTTQQQYTNNSNYQHDNDGKFKRRKKVDVSLSATDSNFSSSQSYSDTEDEVYENYSQSSSSQSSSDDDSSSSDEAAYRLSKSYLHMIKKTEHLSRLHILQKKAKMYPKKTFTLKMPLKYLKRKRQKGDQMFGRSDYVNNGKMMASIAALLLQKAQGFLTHQMAMPLPDLDGLSEFVSDPDYNNVLDGPLEDYYRETGKRPTTSNAGLNLVIAFGSMVYQYAMLSPGRREKEELEELRNLHQQRGAYSHQHQQQPQFTRPSIPMPPQKYMKHQPPPLSQQQPQSSTTTNNDQQEYRPNMDLPRPPQISGTPMPIPRYDQVPSPRRFSVDRLYREPMPDNVVMGEQLQKREIHQPDLGGIGDGDLHMTGVGRLNGDDNDGSNDNDWSSRIPEQLWGNIDDDDDFHLNDTANDHIHSDLHVDPTNRDGDDNGGYRLNIVSEESDYSSSEIEIN